MSKKNKRTTINTYRIMGQWDIKCLCTPDLAFVRSHNLAKAEISPSAYLHVNVSDGCIELY